MLPFLTGQNDIDVMSHTKVGTVKSRLDYL